MNAKAPQLPPQLTATSIRAYNTVRRHTLYVILGIFCVIFLVLLFKFQAAKSVSRSEPEYERIVGEEEKVALPDKAVESVTKQVEGQNVLPSYGGRINPFTE